VVGIEMLHVMGEARNELRAITPICEMAHKSLCLQEIQNAAEEAGMPQTAR